MQAHELQRQVESYWNGKPCDSEFSHRRFLTREFFLDVECERYRLQRHIPDLIDSINWSGKQVLEIGTGVGTDARRIVRSGGRYTGINVDRGSTLATETALKAFGLEGTLKQCDATRIPFAEQSFDIVYTFGVLHHIPDVHLAMREIRRVLKHEGQVIAMVYNRTSVNYAIEIQLLRKLVVRLLSIPGLTEAFAAAGFPKDKLERHRDLARRISRMSPDEWLSRNTDGPDNPYSRVYDEKEAAALFTDFEVTRQQVAFFNHEHWGPLGAALPQSVRETLARRWGWHRIIYARRPGQKIAAFVPAQLRPAA